MLREKISSIDVDALTLGQESLAECLIKRRWYNPFPKFRYTEPFPTPPPRRYSREA